jgi:Predicted membrane protein (DUF2231)
MKLSYLVKGFPGHPLHPPLTDATIGIYTVATAFAVFSKLGVSEENLATAWWLALIAGLIVTGPTALTGLADWLTISRRTPLWRTATLHLTSMVTATVFFLLAAIVGHGDYVGQHGAGPDADRVRVPDPRRLAGRRDRLHPRDASVEAGRRTDSARRRSGPSRQGAG